MSTDAATSPDLIRAVDRLSRALGTHAGGIELVDVTSDGTVKLRYTGMCTGCRYRPLTTGGTVEPVLLALDGVAAVEIDGSRVSDAARRRLSDAFGGPRAGRR